MYPENLRYTKNHEWIAVQEGRLARVGITDYAQHELGDIVFVELPSIDDEFEKGSTFGVVESVKAVSDLYMPVSGKVKEINGDLEQQPELINHSPHDEGWIVAIEMTDEEELAALMTSDEYEEFVGSLDESGESKDTKEPKKKAKKTSSDDPEADDDEDEEDELDGYTEEGEGGDDEGGHRGGGRVTGHHHDDF
ncbi:MAG: glycine cleavage system protein GcvH [Candidatus Riflebacteria bacterium]|nr:glycine cleavage system protein GcvH [Candidatus Riflebacteria bacterium]